MNQPGTAPPSAAKALPPPAVRAEWMLRAVLVGERIDTRGLGAAAGATTTPVILQPAEGGIAFVFRYGVVVLAGFDAAAERRMLDSVRACELHRRSLSDVNARVRALGEVA